MARAPRRGRYHANPFGHDADGALLGGVALRVARRLGASPLVVRVAFIVLGLAAGLGLVLYAIVFVVGVDQPQLPKPSSLRRDTGVAASTASALVVVFTLVPSVPAALLGPLAFVAFALALSAGSAVGADLRSGRAFGRVAVGLALMLGGLFAGAVALGSVSQVWVVGVAVVAVTGGMGVVLAPWLRELIDGASADRTERIRAETRADMAAHLHDSVLQTLTLIQNRVHEPQVASALAHQQERELRRWLYRTSAMSGPPTRSTDDQPGGDETEWSIQDQLEQIVGTIEDDYMVVIDLVCVGDAPNRSSVAAMFGALREALINAAKFSRAKRIALYVELGPDRVLAFVRDRGVGFDPTTVPADRRGIADSIYGRVERLGGEAMIRSTPGVGTEVRIEVPL